jgi:preprotein translocase subunit SecF
MGIQDRDYWRDRYNQNSQTGSVDPTHWRHDEIAQRPAVRSKYQPEQLLMVVTVVFLVAIAAFFGFDYLSKHKAQQLQVQIQDAQARATAQAREQALQRAQLRHQKAKQEEAKRQLQLAQAQQVQSQMPTHNQQGLEAQARKEAAWNKFYQPAPQCMHDATVQCANAFIRAKRTFEAQYKDKAP